MTEALPETSVVSIHGPGDEPLGGGVLIAARHVLTCAHVVNMALGRPAGGTSKPEPDELITVALPLLDSAEGRQARFVATVEAWSPPLDPSAGGTADGAADIAGLTILEPADPGHITALNTAIPARLASANPSIGQAVRIFGFPSVPFRREGHWVSAEVQGLRDTNLNLQLGSASGPNPKIQPGYSGFAVYDRKTGDVLGIVVVAPSASAPASDSRAIGTEWLRDAWPLRLRPGGDDAGAAGRATPAGVSQLTVLHLSDLYFGRRQDPAYSEEGALEQLPDDAFRVAMDLDQEPDLILVTGDLTLGGARAAFTSAFAFLTRLARRWGSDPKPVVVVPGNHDVNLAQCRSYFFEMEAEEETPKPPYYPKWRFFLAALNEFLPADERDVNAAGERPPRFGPTTPWTITEVVNPERDLKLVVAGLNSTMANRAEMPVPAVRDLPDGRKGEVTADQLRWFAERLEWYRDNGWLRLAAVHHNVAQQATTEENLSDADLLDQILGATGLVNVVFHGHSNDGRTHWLHGLPLLSTGKPVAAVPSPLATSPAAVTYQLITLTADGFSRSARRFESGQDRWIGDNRVSVDGEDWRTHENHHFSDVSASFRVVTPVTALNTGDAWPWTQREAPPAHPPQDLLARVGDIVKVRYPRATTWAVRAKNYLLVSNPIPDADDAQWPIGVKEGGLDLTDLAAFEEDPQSLFRGVHQASFVYTGPVAPPELELYARSKDIRLYHFDDFARLVDLRGLIQHQTQRMASDKDYPPARYVPQRYSEPGSAVKDDLAAEIVRALNSDESRLIFVLGDFGRGKTSLLRELARRVPAELSDVHPVLIELKDYDKSIKVTDIVLLHLNHRGAVGVTPSTLQYMIERGQVVLLLDGFDEFELRVGYNTAANYLRQIQGIVSGQAKVVLTSRTQQFLSLDQLGERLEPRSHRIYVLEDFTDAQIRTFLDKLHAGDNLGAASHYAALKAKTDLYELARNPRMLAFIVELGEQSLEPLTGASGPLNPGRLYELLIQRWLGFEEERQSQGGLAPLGADERLDACIELATRMSTGHHVTMDLDELQTGTSAVLKDLAARAFTPDQAAHVIGSGSLLVRTDDGRFAFVHQSVMEWLLAKAAANALDHWRSHHIEGGLLAEHRLTKTSIDFLSDLVDADLLEAWSSATLVGVAGPDPGRAETAKLNALAIGRRIGAVMPDGQDLSHMDLRDEYIRGRGFEGSDLRHVRFDRALLEDVNLAGADLRGARLDGARLVRGRLDGAKLAGSSWERASIVGTQGVSDVDDSAPLAAAAVAGRDPHEVQYFHGGLAKCVAFAPTHPTTIGPTVADDTDSSRPHVLAIGRGSNVELIERPDGPMVRVLSGHRSDVTSVQFSRSGARLLTSSTDGDAILWDTLTGEMTSVLRHPQAVLDAAFGPADVVATACADGLIRLWYGRTVSGSIVLRGHDGPVSAIAFSPDGRDLISGSWDCTTIVWDVARRRPKRTITHSMEVTSVAFSHDGTLFATGSNDNVARVFPAADTGDAPPSHKLSGHTGPINAVVFSPDGDLIGTASNDKSAILWNARTGAIVKRLADHDSWVTGIAFGPVRAGLVATASYSRTVLLWNFAGGIEGRVTGYDNWTTDLSFDPAAGSLLCASVSEDRSVRVWDAARGTVVRVIGPHDAPLGAIAHAPDCSVLAVASIDGTVWLRQLPSGEELAVRRCHQDAITGLTFSADGLRLVTASRDGTARTWHVPALEPAILLAETRADSTAKPVVAVSCGPVVPHTRRQLVLTAAEDSKTVLWDLYSGRLIRTFVDHKDSVTGAALAPDGSTLASCSWDGTVVMRDVEGVTIKAVSPWAGLAVTALAFRPGGSALVVGSRHGDLAVVDDGEVVERERGESGMGAIKVLRYSPEGSLLMVVSEDNAVRCYRTGPLRLVAKLLPLPGEGFAALLPDGSYKLGGSPAALLWWAVKSCRFGSGELDAVGQPPITRLDLDQLLSDDWSGKGRR